METTTTPVKSERMFCIASFAAPVPNALLCFPPGISFAPLSAIREGIQKFSIMCAKQNLQHSREIQEIGDTLMQWCKEVGVGVPVQLPNFQALIIRVPDDLKEISMIAIEKPKLRIVTP